MKVLIDADLYVYRLSSAYDNAYYMYKGIEYDYIKEIEKGFEKDAVKKCKRPEKEKNVIKYVRNYMNDQLSKFIGIDYLLYLSGKANFRYSISTIKDYKANRPKEKPHHFDLVKQLIVDEYGAQVASGIECDDLIAYNTEPYTDVISSIDKDFMQIPGYKYSFLDEKCVEVSKLDSLRYFYTQVYVGDSTDNIPGLYGAGASSKLVKDLYKMDSEEEMFNTVLENYKKRYFNYADQFLKENLQLLWLTTKEEHWPMWIHKYELGDYYKELQP